MSMKKSILIIMVILLLSSCSGKQEVKTPYSSTEALRVMVLPFVQVDDAGNIQLSETELAVDGVPLVSEKLDEDPPELLRQMVQSELKASQFDVVLPYLVNVELPHHGFGFPDGSFNLKKIYGTSAGDLCTKFLDCDAVLFGWVTDWDRSYYGLQSVNEVGLRLRLVSAKSEKTLYEVEVEESEGAGLSGGPTGFSDLVLEPIRGLDAKNIEELARTAARKAVEPLRATARPENVSIAPPSIFAVAHSPRQLSRDTSDTLLVLAFGSAAAQATFSIGNEIENFPMIEIEPGQYVGEYQALPEERLASSLVTVQLIDRYGRSTEQVSASGRIEK